MVCSESNKEKKKKNVKPGHSSLPEIDLDKKSTPKPKTNTSEQTLYTMAVADSDLALCLVTFLLTV